MSRDKLRRRKKKYADILAIEKEEKLSAERLILVDPELMQLAAAWPYVPRTINDVGDSDDPWHYVAPIEGSWADLAGVSRDSRLKKNIERLKTLKLIYSDGSIPLDMKALIQQTVKERYSLPDPKPKKKSKKTKKIEDDE